MIKIFMTFYLLTSISFMCTQIDKFLFKCDFDSQKIEIKEIKPEPFDKNDPQIKRRLVDLDEDGFKNMNIYVDLTNLKEEMKELNLTAYESIFINSMAKAVDTLNSLLKVKYYNVDFNLKDEDLQELQIKYWDKEKFGTENNNKGVTLTSLGIDLLILARFEALAETTLANAGCRYNIDSTGQPIVGLVNINKATNYSVKNTQEYLQSILIHEITHVLGFNSDFFENKFHNIFTKNDQYGIERNYINSSKVLKVARKYYNCPDLDGVELEDYGGSGTKSSHWEARILLGDYMNGIVYTPEQVISEFTLALLEDSGYYKARYYTGGLMRYGKNKGCEFVRNKCVDSDKSINPLFENEFFNETHDFIDQRCSSGRQSRGYYAYWIRKVENNPTNPNYLNVTDYGGWPGADYCPVLEIASEKEFNYYVGQCSEKGSGEFGLFRKRYYPNFFNTSQEMQLLTGEFYSDYSFCFLSSLIKEENNVNFNYSNSVRAVCYEIFCSSKSLTIKIQDNYIICPRAGGKIPLKGFNGFILCPDYNLMCSGTVICNNMFDCVDKKSEIKEESYDYDYVIKTTQNVDRAEDEDFNNEDNYELSEDGICPINCKHCAENKKCFNCRNDYNLVGEINNDTVICLNKSEIEKGYYLNNDSIYYKCIEKCEVCSNGTSCEKCDDNYDLSNGICIGKIENCKEYNKNNNTCKICEDNYAFKGDERRNCTNKEEFDILYYTKDGGISYYECDGEAPEHIKNCKKCYFDNNSSSLECNECQENFVILDEETNQCLSKEIMEDNNLYYYINDTHIKKCSNAIQNCFECENGNKCIKCNNSYYLKNNETNKCYNKSEILPIDEFYLDENNITYYSCNNYEYNSIENCKKCSSKNTCSLCEDEFTFINRNKTKCFNIEELGNKYYQDPNDTSNYNSCNEININCLTCSSFNICLSCINSFGLYKDRKTCVNILENNYYKNEEDNLYYPCNETLGCVECTNEKTCVLCDESQFGLINNTCVKLSELGNKYYKDENTSEYKLCKEGIVNCETCYSKNQCIKCATNYTKVNHENNSCHLISDLGNEYIPDPNDETNYMKCSRHINNCLLCNISQCLLCEQNYIFINDNFNDCISKSSIDINNYCTYNNITYYYPCGSTTIISTNPIISTEIKTIVNSNFLINNESTIINTIKSEKISLISSNPNIINHKTNIGSTNIETTNIGSAGIESSNIGSTNVQFTNLKSVIMPTNIESTIIDTIKIKSTNIGSTNIESTNIESTSIKSTNIKSIIIQSTIKEPSSIQSTNIESSSIGLTNIQTTNILSTNFKSTNFESTNIQTTNFQTTNILSTNIKPTNNESTNIDSTIIKSNHIGSTNIESTINVLNSIGSTNIQSINIKSTNIESTNKESTNIKLTNIKSTNMESTNIETSNMKHSNIETTNIELTNIETSNLKSTKIKTTNIDANNIKSTIIASTNIKTTNIELTNMLSTLIESTNLDTNIHSTNIEASNIKSTDFERTNIESTNIQSSIIESTNLDTNIETTTITKNIESTNIESTNMKSTNIETTIIQLTNIKSTNMKPTNIETTIIESSNIKSTNIERTNMKPTTIETTIIESTNIERTNIEKTNIKSTNIDSTNNKSTNIEATNVFTSNIKPTKIESTNIKSSDIKSSDIKPTNIESTNIKSTHMKSTNIEPTNLNSTFIRSTNIKSTFIEPTDFETNNNKSTNIRQTIIYSTNIKSIITSTLIDTTINIKPIDITTTSIISTNIESTKNKSTNIKTTNIETTFVGKTNIMSTNIETTNIKNNIKSTNINSINNKTSIIDPTNIRPILSTKNTIINISSTISTNNFPIISNSTYPSTSKINTTIPDTNLHSTSLDIKNTTLFSSYPSYSINSLNTMIILQIQLSNNNAILYIMTDLFITKNKPFNIYIIITIIRPLRNLQQIEKKQLQTKAFRVTEYMNNNIKDNNEIVGLSVDKTFGDYIQELLEVRGTKIIVEEMIINSKKYNYNLILGNNAQNHQEINFADIVGNPSYIINLYKIEEVTEGCNFTAKLDKYIEEKDKEIDLYFEELKSEKKIINGKCILSKDNANNILCKLEEEINDLYISQDYVYYDSNELIAITMKNKTSPFYMICSNANDTEPKKYFYGYKKSSSKRAVTIIIIIVIIVFVAIIIAIIALKYSIRKTIEKFEYPEIKNGTSVNAIFNSNNEINDK